jgi:hypothetical protein
MRYTVGFTSLGSLTFRHGLIEILYGTTQLDRNADAEGNGLPDAWQDDHFNGLNVVDPAAMARPIVWNTSPWGGGGATAHLSSGRLAAYLARFTRFRAQPIPKCLTASFVKHLVFVFCRLFISVLGHRQRGEHSY